MTDQGHQIPSQLQMGKEYGMQLLDQALLAAIQAKEIDPEQAYGYATDKRQFQRYVTDVSSRDALRAHRAPEPPWPPSTRISSRFSSATARICIFSPAIRRGCASTASSSRSPTNRSTPRR